MTLSTRKLTHKSGDPRFEPESRQHSNNICHLSVELRLKTCGQLGSYPFMFLSISTIWRDKDTTKFKK